MAKTATAWLSGDQDYHEGLEILKLTGASAFMLGLLNSGPDNYNTPKLKQELEIIAGNEVIESLIEVTPVPPVTEPPAASEQYTPNNNLEKKLRIDGMIRQLFKEITHLHGKLSVVPEGDELFQIAKQIKIKKLKKQDLFDQLHYFNENGVWFDNKPQDDPDPENLEQAIKNLMSQRSKVKPHLKKPLPADVRERYEKKIAALTAKIEALIKKRPDGQEA
ncbi:hypothetical protein EOD41_10785 [Mucilaginibacter limnophilus]|uniref:Uncharacterized protein n=1 Tax=Mucilaginibacter limnophilus TaxID=1932778 RepID=A0A3S3THF8_9SPHI|nr:hypothetical protein [Mucilaginibacter limnophilus]RVU01091.1 hypothetical protein EOD41_10785 [Mucilaginibacter limnophilus]